MVDGETRTQITEHGVFKRVYTRVGKKKRVETQRLKKNPKKVRLGKIGDLEIYVFPYDYPDRVFLGKYPEFKMSIDMHQLGQWFSMYNVMSWFLSGSWEKEVKKPTRKQKRSNRTRQRILTAYNLGLEELKSKKKP